MGTANMVQKLDRYELGESPFCQGDVWNSTHSQCICKARSMQTRHVRYMIISFYFDQKGMRTFLLSLLNLECVYHFNTFGNSCSSCLVCMHVLKKFVYTTILLPQDKEKTVNILYTHTKIDSEHLPRQSMNGGVICTCTCMLDRDQSRRVQGRI